MNDGVFGEASTPLLTGGCEEGGGFLTPRSGTGVIGFGTSPLWEEDSPYFSSRVNESIVHIKNLSSNIKDLTKGMKEFCKATAAMSTASRQLAKANGKAAANLSAISSSMKLDKEVESLLNRFGATLGEIAAAQDTLIHSLTQSIIIPLEEFVSSEMDQVIDLEKSCAQDKAEFVESLGKLLRTQVKGGSKGQLAPGTLAQRAIDVNHGRQSFEQSRQRLASKVDELETRHTLELTESIAACLFALQSFHHQSMDLVSTLNPELEQLRIVQTKARSCLNRSKTQWEKRAEMLEMLLPTDVAERMLEPAEEYKLAKAATSSSSFNGNGSDTASAIFDLVDRKYGGVLDIQASLRAFFRPRASPGIHYESFLFMRAPGKLGGMCWLRRWFILDGSKLYYIKEGVDPGAADPQEGSERTLVCDVVLSTVKEVTGVASISSSDSQYPYAFEIFSANRKSYLLQAEGPHDYQAWILAIRKRIERLLIGDEDDGASTSPRPSSLSAIASQQSSVSRSSSNSSITSSPKPVSRESSAGQSTVSTDSNGGGNNGAESIRDPVLRELAAQNPFCADCNAPHPNWVSINLGIFFCLNCSGIHRSLGVHISKVRSLVLDSLDPLDLGVLRRIGNDKANHIWEHQLLDGWSKPTPACGRNVKEQYIRAKYTWKGFTELQSDEVLGLDSAKGETRTDYYSKIMVEAVAHDDLNGVLKALIRGGDPKWVDPSRLHRLALHLAAMEGYAECVAFLVQNGADPDLKDGKGFTAIDLARRASKDEILRYLSK